MSGARSSDSSGRSGRDTERSSQNSLFLMLSETLTPFDESVLEGNKLKLDAENNKLLSNKGCFAGCSASTIEKNQEKINQINSALENPASVKIEVTLARFPVGLSQQQKYEIQRKILDENNVCLSMNKISLSEFRIELRNFSKEINKEIESHQDILVSGNSSKIEELKKLENKFDDFLKSIPLNLSQKELEAKHRQDLINLKEEFNSIILNRVRELQV